MNPKKSLGQNFLIDPNYRRKIISAVGATGRSPLLEIGPGRGALTEQLVQHDRKIWLIEKDRNLFQDLKKKYEGTAPSKIHLINADFLEVNLDELFYNADKITVVGNLPYNVASQIFIKLIQYRALFNQFFLMFQKEMALRFVAKPNTRDYGLLTLWAQIYTKPTILFHLPPTAFFPKPKVDSSFVQFDILEKPKLNQENEVFFWNFARILFQHRRKTLGHVIKKKFSVDISDLDLKINFQDRAETLNIEQLILLSSRIAQMIG